MKYGKMLGFLAVATAALLAFAGTASATTLTAPSGTTYTGTIKAVNQSNLIFEGESVSATCTGSTWEATIESHGSGVTAGGKVSNVTFTGCNQQVILVSQGTFEYHALPGGSSTITSTGRTYTVLFTTIFGNIHCNFITLNTHFGVMTPGTPLGQTPIFHTDGVIPEEVGGSVLCGQGVKVKGTYKITSPSSLSAD